MTGRFPARFRRPPRDESALLELDDVVRAIAAHGERHREHVTDRPHALAGARLGEVVVAIPSGLQRWISDEFEDLVRRRRDLASRADDRLSHDPIQQYLDTA